MRANRKPLPLEEFEAAIVDLTEEGRGVARVEGKVVFVEGALPGEQVKYRLTRKRRDADEGEVTAILTPSPDRVAPPCPHFGLCGGCSVQHLSPQAQLRLKEKQLLDALQRIGKVKPEEIAAPLSGPTWGYRRRARLSVKHVPKKGRVLVGFRERLSPFVAAIDSCAVLDPRVGSKLKALATLIGELSLRDQIPQIEVAAVDVVALVLRVMRPPIVDDLAKLRAFAAEHEVRFHLQPGGYDSVAPLDPIDTPLTYSPDGSDLRLEFGPTDFIQVNGEVNQRMVQQALEWLDVRAGDQVLELFCGLGNFTLPLARAGAQVTAVEGDAGLVRRAEQNAQRNGLTARFVKSDLFTPDAHTPWLTQNYARVLLDPPRAGATEMIPHIAKSGAERIVYVSCHPGTLARDVGALVHQHGYRLVRAGVMDMFPHTSHVESMALLVRDGD
ncbi:MAG TPA: 23S rRNA (uracil(1939)-C(5))-methyltransferase RlmD [Nevskiaceae bacterium]|nr:23S rRNA (uracil(1939)-C(5))-methyltransferase RlmD [Nevskiaceae bacterium]